MSYTQIIYHIILRTKNSRPTIQQKHAEELYRYIWGIIKNKKGTLYRINGIEDHIHLISDLHPTVALSDYVKDIKVASSVWMKESGLFPLFNGWGDGYCALTYSYNEKDVVINYVKNQQEHHKKETFREEIIRVFKEMGVEIDERFI
ncbi:MAG: IS200/IS605 family transposase [Tannerellaceae bacterium]|nr:IS200/IS605 family transposase [Tannerellaceae bacterium]